jgi:GDPmannose 4,6-dehydratase
VRPDEVYNLAAQSHVRISFEQPEYTCDVTGTGVLRLLEASAHQRQLEARFYQASTSELYGLVHETPQRETTPFYPRSPYAVAKLYGYWHRPQLPRELRDARQQRHPLQPRVPAPRRELRDPQDHPRPRAHQARQAEDAAPRQHGRQARLGPCPGLRRDDVADAPAARVRRLRVATGETHTVREFIDEAFGYVNLDWRNYVAIDPRYYRPTEVDFLLADAGKAEQRLGWTPSVRFHELVRIMVDADLELAGLEAPGAGRRILAERFGDWHRWDEQVMSMEQVH